jgi:hypothetical protein
MLTNNLHPHPHPLHYHSQLPVPVHFGDDVPDADTGVDAVPLPDVSSGITLNAFPLSQPEPLIVVATIDHTHTTVNASSTPLPVPAPSTFPSIPSSLPNGGVLSCKPPRVNSCNICHGQKVFTFTFQLFAFHVLTFTLSAVNR